jgi:hypothetical protein
MGSVVPWDTLENRKLANQIPIQSMCDKEKRIPLGEGTTFIDLPIVLAANPSDTGCDPLSATNNYITLVIAARRLCIGHTIRQFFFGSQ